MSRPLWFVELLKIAFPRRFLAAKTTKVHVIGELVDNMLFQGDDMFYLPKTREIPVYESIKPAEDVVLPAHVVGHYIEKAQVHWIMDRCICRDASSCQDYPIDLGCLFLGEAADGINPKLGRKVTREEAQEHVRRCREAGLVHLIGRNKLDTVWLGVQPGTKLLTICNCCPCCCLWKMLPDLTPTIATKVGRMPGVTVSVSDRCIGCKTCQEDVCFVKALSILDGHAVIGDACRGCGRCVSICPEEAIEIRYDHDHIIDKAISRIRHLVNVE